MELVGIEDNLEDVGVVVVNANVVEDEDKVGMDRTLQEDQPQKYVVGMDNTENPYHAVVVDLNEEVVKNEEVMVLKVK